MSSVAQSVDTIWVLVCTILVLLMQAGFACLESGFVRAKNSINVAIKNVLDFCVAGMGFWLVGFGLMFGASYMGLLGGSGFAFEASAGGMGNTAWIMVFFFFQLAFCSTSTTIVSGAVAERMSFRGYVITAAILSMAIYPVFGHWAWGGILEGQPAGWLEQRGFVDFAGSTVVHSVGGWIALAAILVLGPRIGRFGHGGKRIEPHDMPMATLGMFLLWIGWFGFNGGSTLALNASVPYILVHTMLAAAAGGIAVTAVSWVRNGLPEVQTALNGILAGLVAITANCHIVSTSSAVLIGAGGGLICYLASHVLARLEIDDAVDAVPVHLAAGVWGTLAVALFGDVSLFPGGHTRLEQLGVQALGRAGRPDQLLHFGEHLTLGTAEREVAEILGHAKAARKDQRVDGTQIEIIQRDDLAPRDPRRLDQDVARFALDRLAAQMVHHVQLLAIRREADCFRACPAQRQQGQNGLADLRAVQKAATGKTNSDSGHVDEGLRRAPPRG